MVKYNHALDIGFEVISADANGEDITPEMLKTALLRRIDELDREGTWIEATGKPFDTYELEA
ncbi:hypothetical protein LAV_00208 [Sphingobium phage Lacusarx]|uniref:Uncharacterized protein n=1 Tax=Sphingobium phage Lacusarx TaxID=1980139 RepID=A0A1W6DXD5_9CAUD|nr:hypothetical protein FDH44_gp095 [Sphingobium phage Lacusarx]ARK07583.1 hypothetical protein LAV_00208 [Sphingobium phage Lacusarx]